VACVTKIFLGKLLAKRKGKKWRKSLVQSLFTGERAVFIAYRVNQQIPKADNIYPF
jgi:hypothetical protein